jgi:hypothetical protein
MQVLVRLHPGAPPAIAGAKQVAASADDASDSAAAAAADGDAESDIEAGGPAHVDSP